MMNLSLFLTMMLLFVMSKDTDDLKTGDFLPKKIGRPSIRESGPMSNAELKRRSRANKKSVEIMSTHHQRLLMICARTGETPGQCVGRLISDSKLPRKKII